MAMEVKFRFKADNLKLFKSAICSTFFGDDDSRSHPSRFGQSHS